MSASVTLLSGLSMQVCVPSDWDDERVVSFAEHENPCGTEKGWSIRRQGDEALDGDDERVECGTYADHVHIMLDA